MEISGHTQMLCLIGSPVGHSGSPAMYNYSFRKLGLDYAYLAFDIKEEEAPEAVRSLKLLNVKGFNVTMPCKTAVCHCCDELSQAAGLIGAVNTVVNVNGRWIGHNTDGLGWVQSCRDSGVEVRGKKMAIAGSGGAATAIAVTSALEGIRELSVFARKDSLYDNAEATVEKIHNHIPGCTVHLYDLDEEGRLYEEIGKSDIFTNATRVGMKPMDGQSLIRDTKVFRKGLVVSDVVYNPRTTKLLADAQAAGCKTVPGVGMLLWQGVEAFRLYTGLDMPVEEVRERYFA